MDRVLLTGATGFIGERLAHRLIDEGYDLRLLARTPSKADGLRERGAEVVEGDLTDPDAVTDAVSGVDGVFHLAAVYRLGGDVDWMRRVNVDGTRIVLDAAVAEGVERIVYCGSDISLGTTDGEVLDETAERGDDEFRSAYARTKYEAHELVDERIERGDPIVHAIVSSVYGPGDESPVAELIEMHLAGLAVGQLDLQSGYTFTHVDDVAEALRLAYARGELGESYLVSGEPATFEEFFEALSKQTGIPGPRFDVPDWLVDLGLPLVQKAAPLLGKTVDEVREMVDMGRNITRFFSSEKAQDELGWEPRGLEEGLAQTLPDFWARERRASRDLLSRTRPLLLGMAGFDILLGGATALLPGLFWGGIHPEDDASTATDLGSLVRRTGILWLVFAGVQGYAGLDPEERPGWVAAAGVLRLMDVPADFFYRRDSQGLGWIGTGALHSAPPFNFATGTFLVYAGMRGLRAEHRAAAISQ